VVWVNFKVQFFISNSSIDFSRGHTRKLFRLVCSRHSFYIPLNLVTSLQMFLIRCLNGTVSGLALLQFTILFVFCLTFVAGGSDYDFHKVECHWPIQHQLRSLFIQAEKWSPQVLRRIICLLFLCNNYISFLHVGIKLIRASRVLGIHSPFSILLEVAESEDYFSSPLTMG